MKNTIIALTLSMFLPNAWADKVDCAMTPYYGVCPNCESPISEDDSSSTQKLTLAPSNELQTGSPKAALQKRLARLLQSLNSSRQ